MARQCRRHIRRSRAFSRPACSTPCSNLPERRIDQLLRRVGPEEHARALRRLRPHQPRRNAVQRRRGQRRHRKLRLFRQQHARAFGPSMLWRAARCRLAFPPIEIEGEHYWDGGLVSNTPLQWVLECPERRDTLAFQVDLWNSRGAGPAHSARGHDTAEGDPIFQPDAREFGPVQAGAEAPKRACRSDGESCRTNFGAAPECAAASARKPAGKVYNVIQLIYRSKDHEGGSKDFEFSPPQHGRSLDRRLPGHGPHPASSRKCCSGRTAPDGVFAFDLAAEHGRM